MNLGLGLFVWERLSGVVAVVLVDLYFVVAETS